MRRPLRVLPFFAVPLVLLASACRHQDSSPTELDPAFSTFGDFDAIPEVAYVGGMWGSDISVLSVPEMREIGRINVPGGDPQQFTISSNGHLGYVSHINPDGVTKIDLRTGEALETATLAEGSSPFDLKVTPNGQRLFVSLFYHNQVAAIDTRTMEVLAEIPLTDDTDHPNGIDLGPGGHQAFVANQVSGRVHVIDTRSLELVGTIDTGQPSVNEVAVTQSGKRAFVTSPGTDLLVVIDTDTHEVLSTVPVQYARGVAIPAHGREAYVTGNFETVVIDTETLEVVASLPYPGIRIALNTNGRLAMTTRGVLRLFDVTTPALLTALDIGQAVWDADFAVDPGFIPRRDRRTQPTALGPVAGGSLDQDG